MAIFNTKKEEKKEAKKHIAQQATHAHGVAHEVVRAPFFSEKSLLLTERGVYVFTVPPRAMKADIAGAIKEIYKVNPRKVRIVRLPGKKKTLKTRRGIGTRSARHKAYVYLNAGDTIQFA